MSNLKLIISIIQYLKEESRNESLTPDTQESLEVAVQCLQTACDLEPNDPRLNETEAFSLAALFDIALASPSSTDAPSTSKGTTSDPLKKAEMMKNLGNNLMKRDMFSEAVRYYTAAIDLDNQNAIYYCNRAAAYSKLGDFKNAVIDCEKAVGIDPLYAKAYGRLGLAYTSLNQHQKAIAAFSRALELDPDNESYKSNHKIALEKIDKPMNDPSRPPIQRIHVFPGEPSPFAPLGGIDWRTLFSNPLFRNMASSLMQDPNIISALTNSMNNTLNPNAASGSRAEGSSGATAEGSSGSTAGGSSGSGSERSRGPQTPPPPSPGFDPTNMDALFEAGQYLAAQLEAADPRLVEQIRQNTSRNNSQGPDGSSSE